MQTTAEDLRRRFAQGRFAERAIAEGYVCCCNYRRTRTLATEATDVDSVTLRFHDRPGTLIFVLHCYLRPTGDLGASGYFDPKFLRDDDGTAYQVP